MAIDEGALRALIDKQQIHDVLMRYCRSVDRMDMDLLRSCYWPDATDDHGPYKGSAEGFFAVVEDMSAAYDVTQHIIANEYVELNGDRAMCESYFLMPAGLPGEPRQVWLLGGRYLDLFERRLGEWRILDRTVTYDWDSQVPGETQVFAENPFTRGQRSAADPIYERRRKVLGTQG